MTTQNRTDNRLDSLNTSRIFVLGLDGVPWNLIERWAGDGTLPNFQRLVEEGAAGPLDSTRPPTTPLAWPAIATGTWPDKHGVYGFQNLLREHSQRMYTRNDIKQPELWDLLTPALVGNVPLTYPADDIDGKMASGMLTPEINDRFAHPRSLVERVRSEIPDYQIGLDWSEYDGGEPFLTDLEEMVTARQKLMRLLMAEEDWRLFFFVYTSPDRLQHLVWDERVIQNHYQRLDEILGEVMEYVERLGAALFVVSDHGFGPVTTEVHVNRILEEAGYLRRHDEDGTRGLLARVGVTKTGVRTSLKRLGLDERTVLNVLPQSVIISVAEHVPGDHALYDVNYAETMAFAHDCCNVYVNDTDRFEEGRVSPEDIDRIKQEIAELFAEVVDPETGKRMLDVHDGDDLYVTDDNSPELVVTGRGKYMAVKSLTDEPITGTEMAASHYPEGIFLAWGPEVTAGSTPRDASVVDVAPTILHMAGKPVPTAADGRVLQEVVESDRPVQTASYSPEDERIEDEYDDDFEGVEERLRGLGYME